MTSSIKQPRVQVREYRKMTQLQITMQVDPLTITPKYRVDLVNKDGAVIPISKDHFLGGGTESKRTANNFADSWAYFLGWPLIQVREVPIDAYHTRLEEVK